MANTYTSIGIHFVTGVKYRRSLLQPEWNPRLCGVLRERLKLRKHKLLSFNTHHDHAHLFASMSPVESVSSLAGRWKSNLSSFISEEFGVDFEWQRGYGAFSVGKRDWPQVIQYIDNQEEIHRARRFRAEYIDLLEQHDIDYDEEYLFDDVHLG